MSNNRQQPQHNAPTATWVLIGGVLYVMFVDEEYKLYSSACPALECNGRKIFNWVHSVCGNRMEISVNANIRCTVCRKADSILNWRFSCSGHQNEYRPADPLSMTQALNILKSQANGQDRDWYGRLLINFMHQSINKLSNGRV